MDQVDEIAGEQGWTDVSLLGLALNFIQDSDLESGFVEYLRYVQEEENAMAKEVEDGST